jgi:hypothetical protein
MAANLKQAPPPGGKKDDKGPAGATPKAERAGMFSNVDRYMVLMGLGFGLISICAPVVGIHLYSKYFLVKETVKREYVLKLPPKPGPTAPLFATQITNLKGGRFLRYSVAIQYVANEHIWPTGGGGNAGATKKGNPLEQYEPLMKDVVVTTIGRHSATEMLEPDFREKLKGEIKTNINHELGTVYGDRSMGHDGMAAEEGQGSAMPEVLRVFFTEFVVS